MESLRIYVVLLLVLTVTPTGEVLGPTWIKVPVEYRIFYKQIMHAGRFATEAEALAAGFRTNREEFTRVPIKNEWRTTWQKGYSSQKKGSIIIQRIKNILSDLWG